MAELDGHPEGHTLVFVKREGEGYPGNVGHHAGTTTQEVLRALIDRMKYVDNQIHHARNDQAIYNMRAAIYELEYRAAERHGRVWNRAGVVGIEDDPTCPKCHHIGCEGTCH